MSKIKKYNSFSLVEVLFAIGLLAIFFNMATMFYYDGRKASRKYMDKAARSRSVSTISKSWRNFIHVNSALPAKVEADKIVFKNQTMVLLRNNKLVFTTPEGQKTFTFPKTFTGSFAFEKNSNEAPVLVLYLKSKGSKGQILEDKFIRIIASTSEVKND